MNSANPVYLTAEIREIESIVAKMPDPPKLMEIAGLAAAHVAAEKLLTKNMNKALILAGPGNNGGDAMVVARYLKQWQFMVTLVFTGNRERLSNDAQNALDAWLAIGGEIKCEIPTNEKWDAIIQKDAISMESILIWCIPLIEWIYRCLPWMFPVVWEAIPVASMARQ